MRAPWWLRLLTLPPDLGLRSRTPPPEHVWAAGYRAAQRQAASLARMRQDEIATNAFDAVATMPPLTDAADLLLAGQQAARLAGAYSAAIATAALIADSIAGMAPFDSDRPVSALLAGFQTAGDFRQDQD